MWRNIWNTAKASDIRTQLLQYNQDDCRALKHVVESIGAGWSPLNVPMAPGDVSLTSSLPIQSI